METSDTLSSGAYLGSIFHQIVENSLRKGKSNNNGKSSILSRVTCFLQKFLYSYSHESIIYQVQDAGLSNLGSTELELNIDPSHFTSLALVRKLVLRDKEAAANKGLDLVKLLSGCCLDEDSDVQLEAGNVTKENLLQIPQVRPTINIAYFKSNLWCLIIDKKFSLDPSVPFFFVWYL